MHVSPSPAGPAGNFAGRITAMMLLLLLAPPALPEALPADGHAEQLQLRIGALAEDPRVAGREVADRWFLARFYERREFTPAWGEWAKIDQLLGAIAGSARHGLDPEDYHQAILKELAAAGRSAPRPELATELEVLATDALVRLAFHLRFGKVNPERIESTWNFSRDMGSVGPVTAIQSLLHADDLAAALEALAPDGDYYRALMGHLEDYREIAARSGWPVIEAGETLRLGMQSPRVPGLRALLSITGDLEGAVYAEAPGVYDEAVEAAVKRFQERHGLDADGAVGRQTLAELNVPVEARIDQLRINMERFRWVYRDLEPRFLLVNIARYRVLLIENQEVVWRTRAVVGRPYRQTPVFKARMTYLEFNPTWTVPPTILREDLLPDIRRDPSVLQQRNMTVLDHQGRAVDPATIDWYAVTARNFRYMIRQDPGPDNALGRVKLMFPNPYHVYMHDTPARGLFARAARGLSSGCIRIERPFELVDILLAGTQWDRAAIDEVLASGRTRVVNLPQPITVLTLYGTAVPEAGRIHFAADVYQRDARLLQALDAPFEFSPPAGYEEALQENLPEAGAGAEADAGETGL
jgi:L,D-transpeptidase YcbB